MPRDIEDFMKQMVHEADKYSGNGDEARSYVESEFMKLALTFRSVENAIRNQEMTVDEADALLMDQKNASRALLRALGFNSDHADALIESVSESASGAAGRAYANPGGGKRPHRSGGGGDEY